MEILQQFMEAVGYRLNDAWEHQWASYTNGQALGFTNEFADLQIVFNRETQEAIEISARSESAAIKEHYYRWINPDYLDEIKAESERRGIPFKQALDDTEYTDLDLVEDILEKGTAMLLNEEFDERVMVPLDIGDAELLEIFKAAHKRDMTLNQFIEEALKNLISEEEAKALEEKVAALD